jgi:hypothetical protein
MTRPGVDAAAIVFAQPPVTASGRPGLGESREQANVPRRLELVIELSRLAPPDWNILVTAIEGAANRISHRGTIPEQVAELIRYLESPIGPGLAAIEEALRAIRSP